MNIQFFVCGMVLCLTLCGCGSGRARPQADELYEARIGDGRERIQIVTTRWSDGSYRDWPYIQFRDADGGTWVAACPTGDPDTWEIIHMADDQKTFENPTARKSMTLPGAWIYKLRYPLVKAKRSVADKGQTEQHERF